MKSLTALNALMENCDDIGIDIACELRKLFPLIDNKGDDEEFFTCAGDYENALLGKVGSDGTVFEECTHQEIREIVGILNEMWEIIA